MILVQNEYAENIISFLHKRTIEEIEKRVK